MRCYRASVVLAMACSTGLRAQDSFETIPNEVLRDIGRALPERPSARSAVLADRYSPNLLVTAACAVRVVMVWEGSGYRNSLGYFTYRIENNGSVTVLSADLLVKDASFPSIGSMRSGDSYTLKDSGGLPRTFNPGDKIGFFVIADGFSRSTEVTNWVFDYAGVPASTPAGNTGIGAGLYTTLAEINPEYASARDRAKHAAMIWMQGRAGFLGGDDFLAVGFEDLSRVRRSDDDFNDVVFAVHAMPITAIGTTNVIRYSSTDADGDGVAGLLDHFPDDAARAVSMRVPSSGWSVLAFEDKYPDHSDADYNDAVIAYQYELVLDSRGRVKDILGTFALVARGATYDAGFGVHIASLPADATGTVRIERFVGGANPAYQAAGTQTLESVIAAGKRRLHDVFPDMKQALPPPVGSDFTNTATHPTTPNAAGSRMHIEFGTTVRLRTLGLPPWDPYLFMKRYGQGIWDIHLPGRRAFDDRAAHLPDEPPGRSFLDANKFPWVIHVPDSWRYPMELVSIRDAYPQFDAWRNSRGRVSRTWYLAPAGTGVSKPLGEIIPAFAWTIDVPR